MKKLILLILACFSLMFAHAAYLRNVPMTLNQPDGTVLHCFASGDEFFNYLHDANGYTIMQHPQTGFYVYADKQDDKLVATEFVAGRVDPASKNLKPFNLISPQEWMARRKAWQEKETLINRDGLPNHGTLNNLSIFIRFSDDDEFTNTYSSIDNMFNDETENAVSMRTYFRAASYGAIEIPTYFYPGHDEETIISYQDTYPRSYFQPYDATTNTNGYQDDDDRREREFSLLERAVNYINTNYPVPTNLNIDYNNDGYVDNVCFIVRGTTGAWSSLLWPHKWSLYDRTVRINGKRVYTFNFQLADASSYFNTSVMCHEMNHSLGAPDLYHYYHGENLSPVGGWDLMENNATPPQHCGAYMKMKYGHWVDEIPEITQAGTYTLNPVSSATPTNIAYKIQSEDPDQYYVLEYRDNTSLFETALPGSGLLVYRIDTRFDGNASYDPDNGVYDEVYLFRPGGSASVNGNLSIAHFSSNVGRDEFSSTTSAYPFFTDGTIDNNFRIYDITSAGSTISFTYGTSSECDPPTHLVASVEDDDVTLSWDAAANAASYNIYRGGSLIGNTTGTTYLDSNVAYGRYTYFLKSVDSNGLQSTASETVNVTIAPEGSIIIGDGSSATDNFLPSYSYYKFALTQQIYTSAELGETGLITSIAFYNAGDVKTRTYDFYLKHTTKDAFTDANDWVTVSEADKVFSGSVTMAADAWTIINFSNPFAYDGTSNVVLVTDDNSNAYTGSPHMSCRVFGAPNQALYAYNDNTNFDPLSPSVSSSITHALYSVKNQLLIAKAEAPTGPLSVTVSASPVDAGTVGGGGEYSFGETCTVTATSAEGYTFVNWTKNGEVVSTEATYSFVVSNNVDLVANFMGSLYITVSVNPADAGTVSGNGEYAYGQTCTLIATPAEGYFFLNWTQDGTVVSSAASYSFVVETDRDLVANFAEGTMIGDGGTSMSEYLPSHSNWKYTLSQQIYTPAELGGEGLITSIAFYNDGTTKTRTYDFYMKATTKDSFSGSADWEVVSESDKVFSGDVTMTAGEWTFVIFDTPFAYDGTSNLVLVTDDNTGSYSSGMKCRVFSATSQAIYKYSDSENYDPFSPSSYSGTVMSLKNQVVLTKEPFGDCMAPIQLTADEVGPDFVRLSWTEIGASTEWYVIYGGYFTTATTNEGFLLTGLEPETEYTIMVRPVCDENLFSSPIHITTLESCSVPMNVEAINVTGSTVTVTWNGYDESYLVQLGVPSFLISESFDNGIPSDWVNDTTYLWTVVDSHMQSGNAGQANSTSSITATVTYPSDGTISFDFWSRGEGTNDSYDWDKSRFYIDGELYIDYGNHTGWESFSAEVTAGTHTFKWEYKKDNSVNPAGDCFIVDNVVMRSGETVWNDPVVAAESPYTFRGLTPLTTYCVRVQGVCGEETTEWSETVVFTTTEETTVTQTVSLSSGWNWFSLYVEAEDPVTMLQMLEESLGENGLMIKSTDIYTENDAEWGWFGDLDEEGMVNEQMYKILVSGPCTVNLEGTPANPASHPITIVHGWNWIGFPNAVAISLDDAFDGFAQEGDIIRNSDGETPYDPEWGGWFGDFETLEPGQGYMYYSADNTPRTLIFPSGAK
jgi:M6 family metalloprotease-like protein